MTYILFQHRVIPWENCCLSCCGHLWHLSLMTWAMVWRVTKCHPSIPSWKPPNPEVSRDGTVGAAGLRGNWAGSQHGNPLRAVKSWKAHLRLGVARSWGSLSGELSVPVLLLLCAPDASREGKSSSGITALTLLSNWTCGNCHLLKSAWLGWLLQTESDVKTSLLYLTPGQMFEQISKEAQI